MRKVIHSPFFTRGGEEWNFPIFREWASAIQGEHATSSFSEVDGVIENGVKNV